MQQKTFVFHSPFYGQKEVRSTVVGLYNESTEILYLGVARCSHRDNFSRQLGRTIALGRINSSKSSEIIRVLDKDVKDTFYKRAINLSNQLIGTKEIPITKEIVRVSESHIPTKRTYPKKVTSKYSGLYKVINKELLTGNVESCVVTDIDPTALQKSISRKFNGQNIGTKIVGDKTLKIFVK